MSYYISLQKIIDFRKNLHRFPELSGSERDTQKRIMKFLDNLNPDEFILNIGGYGLAYIYDSGKQGPVLLFRTDVDALPIQESNSIEYISEVDHVAHLCGHDGHIAILCGFANIVNESRPDKGKLVLLFQPAEETGKGAKSVINDSKFHKIKPDISIALHNLPGFKLNTVYSRDLAFASASTGFILKLKGLSSHAAYPENGNNPDRCIAELIERYNTISSEIKFDDFVLITIIHIKLGEVAFGTCPGEAILMLTIRSYLNTDMIILKQNLESITEQICNSHSIKFSYEYTEDFPASINDNQCVKILRTVCGENNIEYVDLEAPFRWSEDFGHFSQISKSLLFGIGSGIEHPQLHNENYDFPDEIIQTGINVFNGIYKKYLQNNE
ncbi:MAG: amidohydrolase [Bacteroidales bacterium]|nr:amidohydrolase [Bacteroidales bacterium]